MLYLKSCPRCHGDVYLDRDAFGVYRECLQCGYIEDVAAAAGHSLMEFRHGYEERRPASA